MNAKKCKSSDMQLVDLAAKAAGYTVEWDLPTATCYIVEPQPSAGHGLTAWDPANNEADSARLAMSLDLMVDFGGGTVYPPRAPLQHVHLGKGNHKRAVLMVAAEIARAMR